MLAEILAGHGYEVRLAFNGTELGERLSTEGPFDLVVTDVAMPWMNGIQVIHRARWLGVDVPVLFISGINDPSLEDWVAAVGPRAQLLRKPFNPRALLDAIARLDHS